MKAIGLKRWNSLFTGSSSLRQNKWIDILAVCVLYVFYYVRIPYLFMVAAALYVFLYAILVKKSIVFLGFRKDIHFLKSLGIAFLLATGLYLFLTYLGMPVIKKFTGTEVDASMFEFIIGNTKAWIGYLFLSWFYAALLEELIFRGFIVNVISRLFNDKWWGMVIAVLFATAIFGYIHNYQGITGIITSSIISIVLSVCYLLSKRNLWLCIFMHGINDTIAFTLMYLNIDL